MSAQKISRTIARIRCGEAAQKDLGELIRHWRKRKGISQGKMAIMMKISAQHLCDVEAGKRMLSQEKLQELEKALGEA